MTKKRCLLKVVSFRLKNSFQVFLGLLVILLLTLGCSSSGDNKPLTEQFPMLAKYADMDEHDFKTFLNSGGDTPLDVDGIKNLTIGSKINTRTSTYIVSPVFNLAWLNTDNKLDKNLGSGTKAETELKMTSKKNASQESGQFSTDVTASLGTACFKSSAAVHYGAKYQETTSTGSIYIDMSYSTKGAYISLLTGDFSSNANFSRYLIGSTLDAAAIKEYVDYTESTVPGSEVKYISSLKIDNKGQLNDADNVYGNMQLLNEMERIFGLLRTQYNDISDVSVREILKQNMRTLRSYISPAVRSFYAAHGDAFVSKVNLMNYGYGSGELRFSESSGNQETTWGVAVSASYQGAAAGGGGAVSVQGARQSGWADAIKKATVTAASFPQGVIDTTGWVTSINSMLTAEDAALTVPELKLPTLAAITLPDPIGPKKDPNEPPDSCFSSMDDWIKYQDMKKKGGAQQDKNAAAEQQEKVDELGPGQAMGPAPPPAPAPPATVQVDHTLYETYSNELKSLTALKNSRKANVTHASLTEGGGNIIRVDNMFVSGFEITPYDKVIPQLRPNLDIPGESTVLDGYPNISKLMYIVNMLGDLDNYLRFLSNLTMSGVSKQMSDNYKAFYDGFFTEAYDRLIATQLNGGKDIPDDLLASFRIKQFGKEGSERSSVLFAEMNDIDIYKYILKLLKPENIKIWRSAPGGYIPFGWNSSNNMFSFFSPYYIGNPATRGSDSREYKIYYDKHDFTEPQYNPLMFYDVSQYTDQKNKTYKSPWYPVFQYNKASDPNLLFVQTIGAYQLVIGAKYAFIPAPNNLRFVNLPLNAMNPKFTLLSVPPGLTEELRNAENGLNNMTTWDYSISFPNTTPDPSRIEQYNALTLVFNKDYGTQFTAAKNANWYYLVDPLLPLGDYHDGWKSAGAKNAVAVSTQSTVDLKTKYPNAHIVIQLLPISKKTCGDSAGNGFSYSTSFNASDLVGGDTYTSSYKMTLFNY